MIDRPCVEQSIVQCEFSGCSELISSLFFQWSAVLFENEGCFLFCSLFMMIAVCPCSYFKVRGQLAKAVEPNALSFLPLLSPFCAPCSGVSYKRKEQWEAETVPSCAFPALRAVLYSFENKYHFIHHFSEAQMNPHFSPFPRQSMSWLDLILKDDIYAAELYIYLFEKLQANVS